MAFAFPVHQLRASMTPTAEVERQERLVDDGLDDPFDFDGNGHWVQG